MALALGGCGSDSADATATLAPTDAATVPSESVTDPGSTPTPEALPGSYTASLTWPEGTDEFSLTLCASQGEHTIIGGGDSDEWNLQIDANLLEPGDNGRLTISQLSDMVVVYSADITSLTVSSDGAFTGSGADLGDEEFTITGTCGVSW